MTLFNSFTLCCTLTAIDFLIINMFNDIMLTPPYDLKNNYKQATLISSKNFLL